MTSKLESKQISVENICWFLLFVLIFLLLAEFVVLLAPFLQAIGWALVIALASWPINKLVKKSLPSFPQLSAAIMTAGVSLVIFAAILPLTATISSEAKNFSSELLRWVESDQEIVLPEKIAQLPFLGNKLIEYLSQFKARKDAVEDFTSNVPSQAVTKVAMVAKELVGVLFQIAMTFLLLFLFFLHGDTLGTQIKQALFKLGGERLLTLLKSVQNILRSGALGMLLTAAFQGFLAGMGYWVAGVPAAIFLGFLTAVASLLPFGAAVIYLPVAAYVAYATGSYLTASLVALWGLGIVSTSDNFLRSYFISQSSDLPASLALIGVIAGIAQFGVLGLFYGPAILGIVRLLWLEWTRGVRLPALELN